jgi:hypothetical protein
MQGLYLCCSSTRFLLSVKLGCLLNALPPVAAILKEAQQTLGHGVQFMERPAVDVKSQAAVLGLDQLYFLEIPQVWLPTVQEVLQADWQDVWQAPHSGVSSGFLRLPATIVLMCPVFFMLRPPYRMDDIPRIRANAQHYHHTAHFPLL